MTATVLILTRNAGAAFAETLAAVRAQQPPPLEILIVDSASTDGTVERSRDAGARIHPIALAEFDFGLTRDLGYSLARGELVANLSQDVIPRDGGWLRKHTERFSDPTIAATTARCEARDPERMFLWQRMGRFYSTSELERFRARYGVPVSNANSAVRREVALKLPHGPMPIAEDLLFQKRAIEAGYRIAWIDEATAWHQHQFTLSSAFKRAFNEGIAARRLEIPYGLADGVLDALRPAHWMALARQAAYGRARAPVDFLYPLLRPLGVCLGHRFGRRLWR